MKQKEKGLFAFWFSTISNKPKMTNISNGDDDDAGGDYHHHRPHHQQSTHICRVAQSLLSATIKPPTQVFQYTLSHSFPLDSSSFFSRFLQNLKTSAIFHWLSHIFHPFPLSQKSEFSTWKPSESDLSFIIQNIMRQCLKDCFDNNPHKLSQWWAASWCKTPTSH